MCTRKDPFSQVRQSERSKPQVTPERIQRLLCATATVIVRFNAPDISWAIDRLEGILRHVEQEDEQIERAEAIIVQNGWPISEVVAPKLLRTGATKRRRGVSKPSHSLTVGVA